MRTPLNEIPKEIINCTNLVTIGIDYRHNILLLKN
jgi:hypothetical protein